MNINSTVSSNIIQTVKCEPDHNTINHIKNDYIQQKQEFEQEITRLHKTYNEQICKLCNELEKSSTSLHQYKLELDSMRITLNIKDKQIKTKNKHRFSNEDLKAKNIQLNTENKQLKKELSLLTTKYQTLFNEIEDARQYLLNTIANLD